MIRSSVGVTTPYDALQSARGAIQRFLYYFMESLDLLRFFQSGELLNENRDALSPLIVFFGFVWGHTDEGCLFQGFDLFFGELVDFLLHTVDGFDRVGWIRHDFLPLAVEPFLPNNFTNL